MPQNSVETKKDVKIEIITSPNSAVYLLGHDMRLTLLRNGNQITNDDVVNTVTHSDEDNEVTVFDIEKSKWETCSSEALKKIEKGRILAQLHSKNVISMQRDDEIEISDGEEDQGTTQEPQEPLLTNAESVENIREDFPEVWLLDDFMTSSTTNSTTKKYRLPDSITSWKISAISMNKIHGIAIAPFAELNVKNQFFTQLSIPYSIRYGEKLRLDIIIHNYVNSEETLTVDVELYEIVEGKKSSLQYFKNQCDVDPMQSVRPNQSISVPYNQVRRVSFYVQSKSGKDEQFVQIPRYVFDQGCETN